jgi:hypothetical protein
MLVRVNNIMALPILHMTYLSEYHIYSEKRRKCQDRDILLNAFNGTFIARVI